MTTNPAKSAYYTPAPDRFRSAFHVFRSLEQADEAIRDARAVIELAQADRDRARWTIVAEMNRQGLRVIHHDDRAFLAITDRYGAVCDVSILPAKHSTDLTLTEPEPDEEPEPGPFACPEPEATLAALYEDDAETHVPPGLKRLANCPDCGGNGNGPEYLIGPDVTCDACPTCDGSGLVDNQPTDAEIDEAARFAAFEDAMTGGESVAGPSSGDILLADARHRKLETVLADATLVEALNGDPRD